MAKVAVFVFLALVAVAYADVQPAIDAIKVSFIQKFMESI